MKAYVSRVGNSPFLTELLDETGNLIREKGAEYGTTTGRPRRVGWLDLVQMRQAVRTNGLTEIAVTKLDVLSGFAEILVCNSYDINGEIVQEMPASLSKIRIAKPIYEKFPGWAEFGQPTNYTELPTNLKTYLEYVEKEIGCPIKIISFGPDRKETILK